MVTENKINQTALDVIFKASDEQIRECISNSLEFWGFISDTLEYDSLEFIVELVELSHKWDVGRNKVSAWLTDYFWDIFSAEYMREMYLKYLSTQLFPETEEVQGRLLD